jgi:Cu(I)/Ag(I) efflux system membrane fusion protein
MRDKPSTIIILIAIMAAFVLAGCTKNEETADGRFFCPMHPTYSSERQGDCPICNMKLVPVKKDKAEALAAHMASTNRPPPETKYRCPNHPEYLLAEPGRCPIDDVKLEPVRDPNAAPVAVREHAGHDGDTDAAAVPGRVPVHISPDKQQLIGLRTSKVEQRQLSTTIRTVGTLEHDETKLARIAPRFGGWIRDLKINYTGQHVHAGEPLLTIYSPDLLSAETEYLLAFRHRQGLTNASPEARQSAQQLLDSARRRLELWQIGEEEIRELEQGDRPHDEVLLRSPVSGHVVAKSAIEGKAFMAGDTLYEIADLSNIWVRAYLFERDLSMVKVGSKANVALPQITEQKFESEVTFIYPHIDPRTRRAEVRLELPNPEHLLRPDMWAEVEIKADRGEVLAVPASAVIDTGERFVAFVKHEPGHLEPRTVKIGTRTDDYYEVLGGLSAGEEVVTRALFLVDSESQLKAAISGMSAGEHQH